MQIVNARWVLLQSDSKTLLPALQSLFWIVIVGGIEFSRQQMWFCPKNASRHITDMLQYSHSVCFLLLVVFFRKGKCSYASFFWRLKNQLTLYFSIGRRGGQQVRKCYRLWVNESGVRKRAWFEIYVKPPLETQIYLYPNDLSKIFLYTLLKMRSHTGRDASSDININWV